MVELEKKESLPHKLERDVIIISKGKLKTSVTTIKFLCFPADFLILISKSFIHLTFRYTIYSMKRDLRNT